MFTYKLQRKLTSELIRTMVKRKRKPRVYNWIARGYKDAMAGTPFKHAPAKNIDKISRDKWSPEVEQYFDGYNSAKEDIANGKIESQTMQQMQDNKTTN